MDIFNWISSNLLLLCFDQITIFCFLFLLCLSVVLAYYWSGHDINMIITAIAAFFLLYGGVLFIVYGGITLGVPSVNETTNITIISAHYTNIEIHSSFTSNLSNNSQYLSLNSTNISDYETNVPLFGTSNLTPIEEARKKLSGGMFANGIGLVGLGIALFSLGLSYWGNIEIKKNNEMLIAQIQNNEKSLTKYKSVLNYEEIFIIGLIWILGGLIYSSIVWIFTSSVIINILFIGVLFLIYGTYKYLESKRHQNQEESFDDMFN